MGVRERGVCDVRRDAHGRRLQRGWLGFFPTPLPGAFDWMLSGVTIGIMAFFNDAKWRQFHITRICPSRRRLSTKTVDNTP